jgi:glucosamine--fructose-6-phosphate aminotransferase (isomerizing)
MCGIAGIVSEYESPNLISNLLSILTNLINRGKDGTGIGYIDNNRKIIIQKQDIAAPEFKAHFGKENIKCNLAIGHVRCPTIGEICDVNSHPILDCTGNIAVVHNGTITNHGALRAELADHEFKGSVDSEVIPHLIEKYYDDTGDLEKSIRKTISRLEGYYTFSVISNYEPVKVYLYRHHFPLVLYTDKDAEKTYFSSERKPLAQLLNKRFRAKHLKPNELLVLNA